MKRTYILLLAIIFLSSCSQNGLSSEEIISSFSNDNPTETSQSDDNPSSSEEEGPVDISSVADLQAINDNLDGDYELINDITLD